MAFVFYDANLGGHAERYSALSQYLVFDDDWGTNRGYCWRIGWQSYRELPFLHQLFGFGPDTYGILTWDFRQDALDRYGVFYESAHNEYFQYLVTMGPLALASYLAFLGSACVRMCRKWKECAWILAPVLAVLCYGAQAVVNINLRSRRGYVGDAGDWAYTHKRESRTGRIAQIDGKSGQDSAEKPK